MLLQRFLQGIRHADVVPLEADEKQFVWQMVAQAELRTQADLHQLLNSAVQRLHLDWTLDPEEVQAALHSVHVSNIWCLQKEQVCPKTTAPSSLTDGVG